MARQRVVLSKEKLELTVGGAWSDEELTEAARLLAHSDGRFPPGVRTIPPELVREIQRERLLASVIRAVTTVGYNSMAVQDILDYAGISRPTFYEFFRDKEACFLAALDGVVAQLRSRIAEAVDDAGPEWRERLRAGLEALLTFVEDETEGARVVIVEARASSPEGMRRRDELLESFSECIDGMIRAELADPPSALAAAGVVGGIESVIYARLRRGEIDELESLLPSLMYFAVLTYAGKEAAAGEIADAATTA